uniref:Uncharacterized protein n=1 Tax=Zosterops lateralis melanops TaxID=1220523 RepID=A0A8D2NT68_ZOSLA
SKYISEIFSVLFLVLNLLKQLSFFHRNLCNHGKYFLAANSSLCGLAANNFFRNILHVRKASLVSALPMAVIPFLSTAIVYEAFVHDPLFSGKNLFIPFFTLKGLCFLYTMEHLLLALKLLWS